MSTVRLKYVKLLAGAMWLAGNSPNLNPFLPGAKACVFPLHHEFSVAEGKTFLRQIFVGWE